MSTLTRALLNGFLPAGSAWRPATGGMEDRLFDGMADNSEAVRSFVAQLSNIRDPYTTPILPELEREYGIQTNMGLTLATRQAALANRKFNRASMGTPANLQTALNLAGFGVGGYGLQVIDNNGGADPRQWVGGAPYLFCGQTVGSGYGCCGNTYAFAGQTGGGQHIVNGNLYTIAPNYWGCGMATICCGNNLAYCGYYTSLNYSPYVYSVPADSGYWPLVFFLAQSATYTGATVATLTFGNIPSIRQQELVELVLRYKPIHTWAILMANFV